MLLLPREINATNVCLRLFRDRSFFRICKAVILAKAYEINSFLNINVRGDYSNLKSVRKLNITRT